MLDISEYAIQVVRNKDSVITNVQCQEATISLHDCHNVEMKNISLVSRFPLRIYPPQPAISINDCNWVAISKSVVANFGYQDVQPGWPAILVLSGSSNYISVTVGLRLLTEWPTTHRMANTHTHYSSSLPSWFCSNGSLCQM